MDYDGIIVKRGDPDDFSEEELNQGITYHFSDDPGTPNPINEVSNVLYENSIWALKIEYGYKHNHKCTGILIKGKRDKKFRKYGVRIIDLTRVTGDWDINTSDIRFDFEVLCKIGYVEMNGEIYRTLQCFPT